ncbi:MAG: zinc metallopeptidase [Planctomycetes bacterium]|nr:zinc metallopeptidase [Planctomycetota bacterium]
MDLAYLVILGSCALLSLAASLAVRARYARASRVMVAGGMSGAEAARAIIDHAGIDARIVQHDGFLSDHYNPATRTLALSSDVYHGRHAAAVGVAAHEAGHALQHAENYLPMWARSALVPLAGIGSNLGPWLVIAGIAFGAGAAAAPGWAHVLALAGVGTFACATAFSLVTLPVEFDASARARRALDRLAIVSSAEERAAVSGVLTAAGLTYVAAAVGSLLQLVYWASRIGLFGGQNRE